ncbi:MAG TPA: BatA domain-containing protein [Vicinamibacterales bacterium]|nr:BatA domain-containing protein [Vicinamibacterales bacterium]
MMSIAWIAPAALMGLALIALPIAVHLLVRQHARVLAYPSLRFLRETQLAALRRRTIQDAALLLCRVAIIAAAAIALTGPVLQTPARTAGYARRMSRAIVAIDVVDPSIVAKEAEGAFTSATFRRASIADALADASRWLDRQPPSSREIVIAGELRRGVINERDLAAVPAGIGIRFLQTASTSNVEVTLPVLTRRNGVLMRIDRRVQTGSDTTRVTDQAGTAVANEIVTIVAKPADTALAEAALRAALDAGIPWADFDRRVSIVWEGAPHDPRTPRPQDPRTPRPQALQVFHMPVPSPPAAADAVRDVLTAVSPPDLKEPIAISAEQLAVWTRSPGPPAANAPLFDEGDRRWLWGLAIVLLALESWLRRPAESSQADRREEPRVA